MGGKPRFIPYRASIEIEDGLQLRALTLADAQELMARIDQNRARLRQWMPWLDTTTTLEELKGFVGDGVQGCHNGSCYRLGIYIDTRLSGVISLEDINHMHRYAKIGYWLASEQVGRGHVSKAVEALIAYAFQDIGLNLVELRAATENVRSRAVAERAGMSLDGVLRQREWLYDRYVDLAVYSLLAEPWRQRRRAS